MANLNENTENLSRILAEIQEEAEENGGIVTDAFVESLVLCYDVSMKPVLETLAQEDINVEKCDPAERKTIINVQIALHGSEEYKGLETTYLREISLYPLLTKEEEHDLAVEKDKGNKEAYDRLVKSNLRLVVAVAKKYMGHNVPLMDLIQEGNIGLMKGIQRFNPYTGTKLSTYAVWWIRQAIIRYFANCGEMIRKPVKVHEQLLQMKKAERKLTSKLGRTPTKEELSKELHISLATYEMLRVWRLELASIDKPVGEDGDFFLSDCIEDKKKTPDEEAEQKMLRTDLEWSMDCLTEQEKDVVCMRTGFYDDEPRTLAEIGDKYGLSRERIRQIESKAYKKLRNKRRMEKLEGYVGA